MFSFRTLQTSKLRSGFEAGRGFDSDVLLGDSHGTRRRFINEPGSP